MYVLEHSQTQRNVVTDIYVYTLKPLSPLKFRQLDWRKVKNRLYRKARTVKKSIVEYNTYDNNDDRTAMDMVIDVPSIKPGLGDRWSVIIIENHIDEIDQRHIRVSSDNLSSVFLGNNNIIIDGYGVSGLLIEANGDPTRIALALIYDVMQLLYMSHNEVLDNGKYLVTIENGLYKPSTSEP